MSDNVHISISIEISVEGEYDTGMTVEEWNALTDQDRSRIVTEVWSDEASGHDNGGMSVITEGAVGI